MGKDFSLSSDINLIREFEELKLKQQLLVKALQSKNKLDKDKLLVEMNSKLDFIVDIFKKTSEDENSSHDDSMDKLIEKIDTLDKKMEEKFSELDKTLLREKRNKEVSSNPSPPLSNPSNSSENISSEVAPLPKPNFKVPNKKEESPSENTKPPENTSTIQNEEEAKKKKKWF